MNLKGKNIYLRALEPDDVDILYKWENNPENWHVSNTLAPLSCEALIQYVNLPQDIYTAKELRLIICLNNNTPIGCVDLFEFDAFHQRAGVGILIADKAERGKGYAGETLDVLIDYCFNVLLLHQLWCNIGEENEASIQLFTKKCFSIIGVKKDWLRTQEGFKNEYMLQLVNYNEL